MENESGSCGAQFSACEIMKTFPSICEYHSFGLNCVDGARMNGFIPLIALSYAIHSFTATQSRPLKRKNAYLFYKKRSIISMALMELYLTMLNLWSCIWNEEKSTRNIAIALGESRRQWNVQSALHKRALIWFTFSSFFFF